MLLRLIRDLFAHYERLKGDHALARHVQFPKIPPVLTESLAILLINSGVLLEKHNRGASARFSDSGGDILLGNPEDSPLRIEVKGTAESAFQHFGPKDLAADVLIWIHYGKCFREGGGTCVTVAVIENPARFISMPSRITLTKLAALSGDALQKLSIDLDSFTLTTPKT